MKKIDDLLRSLNNSANIWPDTYGFEEAINIAEELKLSMDKDGWVKFNYKDTKTYPPANIMVLFRCFSEYIRDRLLIPGHRLMPGVISEDTYFFNHDGYATHLKCVTHWHPLPPMPEDE